MDLDALARLAPRLIKIAERLEPLLPFLEEAKKNYDDAMAEREADRANQEAREAEERAAEEQAEKEELERTEAERVAAEKDAADRAEAERKAAEDYPKLPATSESHDDGKPAGEAGAGGAGPSENEEPAPQAAPMPADPVEASEEPAAKPAE